MYMYIRRKAAQTTARAMPRQDVSSTESQLQRVIRADVRQAHMLPGSKREEHIQANLTHRKVLLFFAVWPHAFSGAADASVARQRRGEPGLRSSSVLGPSSTPVPGVCRGALPPGDHHSPRSSLTPSSTSTMTMAASRPATAPARSDYPWPHRRW